MQKFRTEQEEFWAGDFGVEYINRNKGKELQAANLNFFARALKQAHGLRSCVEFGANIGMNARALQLLYPSLEIHGIEINPQAADQLSDVLGNANVYRSSIMDFLPDRTWDLALIKGVLIHINPDFLADVYDRLFASSSRYILVAEYYNPVPVSIPYRGHDNRLFKRDFAGEIMRRFPVLRLVDYGFAYHLDPVFPQDDITWFLMEKKA